MAWRRRLATGVALAALCACSGATGNARLSPDAGTRPDGGRGDAGPPEGPTRDGGIPVGPAPFFTQLFGDVNVRTESMSAASGPDGGFITFQVFGLSGSAQLEGEYVFAAERSFNFDYLVTASGPPDAGAPLITGYGTIDPTGNVVVAGTCSENVLCPDGHQNGSGQLTGFLHADLAPDGGAFGLPLRFGTGTGTLAFDGIDHDPAGNEYVFGRFSGDEQVGGWPLSSPQARPFLARFDRALQALWASDLRSAAQLATVDSIAVGPSGLVLVGGRAADDAGTPAIALFGSQGSALWRAQLDALPGRVVGLAWSADEWVAAEQLDGACDPLTAPCTAGWTGELTAGDAERNVRWRLPVTGRPEAIAASPTLVVVGIDAQQTLQVGTGRVTLPPELVSIAAVALHPDGSLAWQRALSAQGPGELELRSIAIGSGDEVLLCGDVTAPVMFEFAYPGGASRTAFFSMLAPADGGS